MEDRLVDMLREISEEGDLNGILKPTIGGYSKRSVAEYLGRLKKQQQSLKDSYAEENGRLLRAQEQLQSELDGVKARAAAAEAEFQVRLESDTAALREELAALEADMEEALQRISEDEKQAQASETALAAARQDTATVQILLDTANARLSEQEQQLDERAEKISLLQSTVQSLQEALSEDVTSGLHEEIQRLRADVAGLQGEVGLRDRELENRGMRLDSLSAQEREHRETIETLELQMQKLHEQNERLESENDALGQRLREQLEQGLALCRENARIRAEYGILQRRSDTELMRRRAGVLAGTEV